MAFKAAISGTDEPPPPPPQGAPASAILPLASAFRQLPLTGEPLTVANLVVLPDRVPCVIGEAPLPMRGSFAVKLVDPVPPCETPNVPSRSANEG